MNRIEIVYEGAACDSEAPGTTCGNTACIGDRCGVARDDGVCGTTIDAIAF